MFMDDASETWDSSEFQDSFIKDYFGKRKVSKQEANNELNAVGLHTSIADSNSLISKKKRKRISKNKNKDVTEEERLHLLHSSHYKTSNQVDRNEEGKQLLSNKSSDNYIKSHEINSDLDQMELDFPIANSNSVKPKKKRKQKRKNKVVEEHSSLTSSHCETPKQINNDIEESSTDEEETDAISNHSSKKKKLFQSKLCQKLQAAKFRYLNEMLYTNTGKDALLYFQGNTEEFQDYHVGYQSQVSKWPINPVDIIIEELSQMNKQNVIADLGCGEAKIAEVFPKRTVHSFDLIAVKDCVTACDMANVPLPNSSVDAVVFCLSLMGTNWKDYLKEGHRLLKLGAVLKIAEIESRIDNLNDFIKNIIAHGFSLVNKNMSHKMFIFLNFKKVKSKVKTSKIPNVVLKPCLYKKR